MSAPRTSPPPTPDRTQRVLRVILVAIAVALLVAGLVIARLSLDSFETFRARVDVLAEDGTADGFTRDVFAGLVAKFRLLGAALLLLAAGLVALRRPLGALGDRAARAVARFAAAVMRRTRRVVRDEPVHVAALATIVACGLVLRLRFLGQPMRFDEADSFLEFATKPFYVLLSDYSAVNNHVLHTALVRLSYLVFGNHPWAIRLPAFVAGVLMIPAAYLVGRRLYHREAGLVGAALVASSSILVEYSTNARGYTILTIVFLLLVALATHLVRARASGGWIVFAVLGATGFFTLPVMLYPFGVVATWLLLVIVLDASPLGRPTLFRRAAVAIAAAAALTLALYVPVFTVSGVKSVVANKYVVPQSWTFFADGMATSAGLLWRQWTRDLPAGLSILVTVGLAAALVLHRRLARDRVPPVLAAALVWIPPVLLLQRVVPAERIWLFLLPLLFVTAGGAIGGAVRHAVARHRGAGLGAGLTAALVVVAFAVWPAVHVWRSDAILASLETGTLRDAPAITSDLRGRLRDGDRVLAIVPSSYPLAYYFVREGVPVSHLLLADPALRCRLLVVVDRANGQTLMSVLQGANLAPDTLGRGRTLARYRTAQVVVFDRHDATRSPADRVACAAADG